MSTITAETTNQYLTFNLGAELYAVNVEQVNEVLEMMPISKIPKMPEFMRGVINVRGAVVPVVDLRRKFELPDADFTVDTCIIVTEIGEGEEKLRIGIIVDNAREVIRFSQDELEPCPKIGTDSSYGDFIENMGKYQDDFVMILNINRVFSETDMEKLGAEVD